VLTECGKPGDISDLLKPGLESPKRGVIG